MAGAPRRPIDVAGEERRAAAAALARHHRRLGRLRRLGVGQLGRIRDVAGHHGERRAVDGRERHAILGAGDQRRAPEALENRVRALDAAHVGVAGGPDDLAGLADPEDVGEREVGPGLAPVVEQAGLERAQERAAAADVSAAAPRTARRSATPRSGAGPPHSARARAASAAARAGSRTGSGLRAAPDRGRSGTAASSIPPAACGTAGRAGP